MPVFYFYFPPPSGMTDAPSPSQFALLALDVKKNHREVEIAHVHGVVVMGFETGSVYHFGFEEVRPNVFKVTPAPNHDLVPGEYAFIAATKLTETGVASFFEFGVDRK
jgi:hypothetical protein